MNKSLKSSLNLTVCALCEQKKRLHRSHIIPQFVFDWLKETSADGHIRGAYEINKRAQDGLKPELLCGDCEGLFSKWEKQFAENIFVPVHNDSKSCSYGTWMEKFIVSVSWRVLTYYNFKGLLTPSLPNDAREALLRWREFLLGSKSNPGPFEQHVLLTGSLQGRRIPFAPPTMNRYLHRAVDFDVYDDPKANRIIVYSKLGRIILLGFIKVPDPNKWRGTKVRVKSGFLTNKYQETEIREESGFLVDTRNEFKIPVYLVNQIMYRARLMDECLKELVPNQKENINKATDKDRSRVYNSEHMRALAQDYMLFGKAAFDGDK